MVFTSHLFGCKDCLIWILLPQSVLPLLQEPRQRPPCLRHHIQHPF